MKKLMKKITAAFLAAATLAAIPGCSENKEVNVPRKEFVYRAASAEISEEMKGDLRGCLYTDGSICFLSDYYPDREADYHQYFLNFADTSDPGKGINSVKAEDGTNVSMTLPCLTNEGKICWFATKDTDSSTDFLIKTADPDGSNITEVNVTDKLSEDSDFYASFMGVDGKGNYIIGSWYDIAVIDSSYELKCMIRDVGDIDSVVFDKNGNPYVYSYGAADDGNMGMVLRPIDTETGTLGDAVPLPEGDYGTLITPGTESDFILCANSVIYRYDLGSETAEEIFGMVEAGISPIEAADIFLDGETFLFAGKSYPYDAPKFSLVTKQPAPENDRKEIVLAGDEYAIDTLIENEAVKFNNVSDDFYVTIKKYDYDNTDQLNMDLISGNIPDIFISDNASPMNSYISKGMFADMYEFMDSDPDISRSDFVQSFLKACETDGKLYRISDSFQIYTVLGKEKIFGSTPGMTYEQLTEIAAGYPDGTEAFPGCTKYDLLGYAMELTGSDFIDYKNGKCSFDSERFISLLKFSNALSENIDLENYFDDSFWDRFETMYSEESSLLMTAYLTDFTDLYRFERAQFADKVTAVGFPCENGMGTAFVLPSGISISAKADKDIQAGAWQFVKRLLSKEYQDMADGFPVRNDSLQKLAEHDMTHDPDRINNAIVIMGSMALSASVSDIGEPTREDVDKVMEIIETTDKTLRFDQTALDIISEEAAEYYGGSRTAEEAAKLIQMRVQLYLTEQM